MSGRASDADGWRFSVAGKVNVDSVFARPLIISVRPVFVVGVVLVLAVQWTNSD